jgi:uncharacterized membrane protein
LKTLSLAVALTLVTFGPTATPLGHAEQTNKAVVGDSGGYQIEQVPLRPNAVSNSEWVAGSTEDQRAATWQKKSGLHRISLPPELNFSEATDINSHGEAVGTASDANSGLRVAFVSRENKVTLLPGGQGRANSINEGGQITGQAIAPGTKVAGPVFWKDDNIVDLPICCAGVGKAINTQRLIAGDTYDEHGRYHAFVWDTAHGKRMISVPGSDFTSVLAINDHGDILLKATPGGLFLFSDGNLQTLEIPQATPRAMNNNGVIVGSFGPGPEEQRAFVWDKTNGLRDLNSLIPANSGWTLEVATSVNDQGEIVGRGDCGDEDNVGFFLRPRKPLLKQRKPHSDPR